MPAAPPEQWTSFLVLRGIKTLHLDESTFTKMAASSLAGFLKTHPKVDKIYWPGFTDHPNHEIAKKQMLDFGGMISIATKRCRFERNFSRSFILQSIFFG